MAQTHIEQSLHRLFHAEHQRIVFWHDPDPEFEETLPDLDLGDVTLLRLDQQAALAVKVRLEQEDPDGRYLLYAAFEAPAPADDWLLDIRLYSAGFRADRASILLDELGLRPSLHAHLTRRARFFANRGRQERFARLVRGDDQAIDIDRKIIAVLVQGRRGTFRARRRDAPGAGDTGDPGAPYQIGGQGEADPDPRRPGQRAGQQLQGHLPAAALRADPDRGGRRPGQAGDPEGRHLRRRPAGEQ